ncbi:hypothetical protein C5748_19725 [Phyllobacterium phragmitis]|uniref:Uncharacterized protein n=2 Tax=Phyllobacterium phragmitis TaxID=2670329 RepID=A0A2S9IN23_9HYPH|nr:hypothetical protein C5748_19725 [Phyllobacterium phragmitis]
MMKSIIDFGFTIDELNVIKKCLAAVVEGRLFDDWEFQTLFGVNRNQVAITLSQWPNIDLEREESLLAITGSIMNLIGYPHGRDALLKKYVSSEELRNLSKKWQECNF